MRKIHFVILLSLIFAAGCIMYVPYSGERRPPAPEAEEYYQPPSPGPGLDISYFYEYLSPYGIWIYHPAYRYVWVPYNMPYGWRPYTLGHWIWTDYGWTWHSTLVWGWAPFHYGRWGWERDLGWFWVPDVIWGPCWVTWRSSNIYIGWAPLPPGVRFVPGVGIRHIAFNIPEYYWIFVDGTYFLTPQLHLYIFPRERNVTIIRYTVHQTNISVRGNMVVNEGIGVDRVQRITRQKITKYELKDAAKPEARREAPGVVEVYRPQIKKSEAARPKTVLDKEEASVKISRERMTIKATEKEKEAAVSPGERERSLKEMQERELKLLEKSQEKEIEDLIRNKEAEKQSARTETEKARIEREHQSKVINIKKSHEGEKTSIQKRHEEEKKQAVKKEEEEKKEGEKKVIKKKKDQE